MRVIAASLLALAACHSDGSLEIWVEPRPDMTLSEVELYVGIHAPHIGESIRPMQGALAETVWWKRDHNRSADILAWDAEAMERGAVRYQLLADGLDEVRALVAVGYLVDSGVRKMVGVATYMHDSEIGSGEIHRRYMTLGDFDPLPRRAGVSPRPDAPGIQIWGPPDDPAACVQVDNAPELDFAAFGAPNATSGMIVMHDDRDCDGYKQTEAPDKDECVPEEYNSIAPRTRDSLSCVIGGVVPGPTTPMMPVCLVGGPTCSDGLGDLDCAPSTWCAPTSLCPSPGTPSTCDDFVCDDFANAPQINCALFYNPESSRWCSGTKSAVTLGAVIPGIECDPTRVTMMRKPLMPAWFETLAYGSVDEMWLTVAPKAQNLCEFEFTASGPLQINPNTNLAQDIYRAAIGFPLKRPVDGRGIAMPLTLRGEPSPDCAELIGGCQVTVDSSDVGLKACIAAPIADPAERVP